MAREGRRWTAPLLLAALMSLITAAAALGATDPYYRNCTEKCERTGQIQGSFFPNCQFFSDNGPDRPWYMQEPLYLRWKQWNCKSECHYSCMMETEKEREKLGLDPVKYVGKWPFKRVSVMQEPVSAALSAFDLTIHFHGWLSFLLLVHYKLPQRPESRGGGAYYECTFLWHVYGILAMNASFWSAIYHIQYCNVTKLLDCSSMVALFGYSLMLAILRVFNVKVEASRVMVAAPLLSFVTTHIMYLNFYQFDLGFNMKVCLTMGVIQLFLWAVWACTSNHPSRSKILTVVIGSGLSLFLGSYDFPPYKGYIDAHALLHIIDIPLACLWWSFVKDDAVFRTTALLKKTK